MKLIIQIPCYNEEATLPRTLAELPASIGGVDEVEVLVVNDGSTDGTVEAARRGGVRHIVSFTANQGLAKAFTAGLEASLRAGADIIVNTDADNQYRGEDIPRLIRPILDGEAEIVIGARPIEDIQHFSRLKKLLQRLGSWVLRRASGTDIPDSPSGFRAFSREAALKLNVFNEYTYTLETIIQAGLKGIPITWTPVRTNPPTRPSRLVKSIGSYVWRSVITIIRIFVLYRPLEFFWTLSVFPIVAGAGLMLRWLLLYLLADPTRARAPSLIVAAVLLILGALGLVIGLICDLLAANRKLLEEIQLRLRRQDIERGQGDRRP